MKILIILRLETPPLELKLN